MALPYTLNLGSFKQGTDAITAYLGLTNDAAAPADWLDGYFSSTDGSPFVLSGFTKFSDLLAGATKGDLSVALNTANVGDFDFTVYLYGRSVNGSDLGGTAIQGLETIALRITGDVSSVPIPSALWLLGSGLLGLIGIRRRKQAASKLAK